VIIKAQLFSPSGLVADVVPILENIIETEGNSLVQIQLPKKWRVEQRNILTAFLARYDSALNRRRLVCSGSHCERICEGTNDFSLVSINTAVPSSTRRYEGLAYGMNCITCSQCTSSYCSRCQNGIWCMFCKTCEKIYCSDCNNEYYERKSACSECDYLFFI
jgi:hypothetical protein